MKDSKDLIPDIQYYKQFLINQLRVDESYFTFLPEIDTDEPVHFSEL